MDFYGTDGVAVAITAYIGDLASGLIDLYFVGAGYGGNPTNPGVKLKPVGSSPNGDRSDYLFSSTQLDAWQVDTNDRLRFLIAMRGTNIAMGDIHYFLRAVQGKARLRAAEAGQPLNGDGPYDDVACGAKGSGLTMVVPFTLQLA